MKREKAALILEDSTIYQGYALGILPESGQIGEVVFNTSMSGYQEIITDPSYMGQIVCFTYPSIGNYGTNAEDHESARPHLEGILVRDYCEIPSNFRSTQTLEEYLASHNLPGITGIDTRALVRKIREAGSMKGGIFAGDFMKNPDGLKDALQKIKEAPSMEGQNLAKHFDGKEAAEYAAAKVKEAIKNKTLDPQSAKKIALLDFGVKYSIIDNMVAAGIIPEVFAGDTPLDKWQEFDPEKYDGFFYSNGPGDPGAVKNGIENIKKIGAFNKPVFGICLGHQMLSTALGAETYKLKFGHHGGNQPVKKAGENQVIITAQNHGFAVKEEFFQDDLFKDGQGIYEINPNDQTIEGFYLTNKKIISVQYHPEAGPGPNDALPIFQEFRQMMN